MGTPKAAAHGVVTATITATITALNGNNGKRQQLPPPVPP